VLEAALIAGHPRRERPLWAVDGEVDLLRKTS
jgi:hypothetical protein